MFPLACQAEGMVGMTERTFDFVINNKENIVIKQCRRYIRSAIYR